jgi:hypothetical protein
MATLKAFGIEPEPQVPAEVRPEDILTPKDLAKRLKVTLSWVFEQTRERTRIRSKNPMPFHKRGKKIWFWWPEVARWLIIEKC